MLILAARWEGKQGGNMAEEMLISAEEMVLAIILPYMFGLIPILAVRWEGKHHVEEMIISAEESVMAILPPYMFVLPPGGRVSRAATWQRRCSSVQRRAS